MTRRELAAVAGFLAGYGPSTRRAYGVDLRLFADWCHQGGLDLFNVGRSHLELFGRWMKSRGLMASTIARRSAPRRDHAPASLLALNRLRVSEALNADVDDLGFERGHHTLAIVRKGNKHATIPLAPRTARAVQLYVGERSAGPIFVGARGARMDRHAADRTAKPLAQALHASV